MSAIVNFSLDLSKLPKEKMVKGKKGTYINLSLSVKNETKSYGKNAYVFIAQSQEEREAKQDKTLCGSGQVVWTDGTCVLAEKNAEQVVEEVATSDLPF